MRFSQMLLILFLVATGLLDALFFAAVGYPGWNTLTFLVYLGLALSQVGLLAVWVVMGRLQLLIRLGGLLAGIMLLAVPLVVYTGTSYSQWLGLLLLYAGAVAVPFLGLWVQGWQLCHHSRELAESRNRSGAPFRFTLAGMLALLTGIGIVLALAQVVELPRLDGVGMVTWLGFVAILFVTFWGVWSRDPAPLRLVLLLATPLGVAVALATLQRMAMSELLTICTVLAGHATACLLLCHAAGFRFQSAARL